MATARPVVSVYKFDDVSEKAGVIAMPHVLASPLRPDWVQYIHMSMAKNSRMPYAVGPKVGYETAAESWGTGRAVARIPRAPGGGTHRAGQGAFGNMCRGGGMFAPTKTWRKWHRRINLREKRNAVVTALAASTLPPLVMARGHRIDDVRELPIVVTNGIQNLTRTRPAVKALEQLGLKQEMTKVINSKVIRAGRGKVRGRKYMMRKGPMVVYKEDKGIVRAMRNIPGVNTACVTRLNLMKLAPGGNFGRLIVWTEDAFRHLNKMYGTLKSGAPLKRKYILPRCQMENADISRIINSQEVQSVLRPKLEARKVHEPHRNALKNKAAKKKLNPYEKPTPDAKELVLKRKARMDAKKEHNKKHKKGETWWKRQMMAYEPKPKADADEEEEE